MFSRLRKSKTRVHVANEKAQNESLSLNLTEIVPTDKADEEFEHAQHLAKQRQVKNILDAESRTAREKISSSARNSTSVDSQSDTARFKRSSTFGRFSTQLQNFFANMRKQREFPMDDETSETSEEETVCEVPVNPMKTLLGTVSNNAFVSWTHISKIIQAMEIIHDDIDINTNEMNKVMLKQCIKLLKDSPYVLKSKTDQSLAHKPAKFYKKSETDADGNMVMLKPKMPSSRRASVHALQQFRQKVVEFNTLPYGTASNDVSSFVANMVHLHMDSAFNIFSENNGVVTNNGTINIPQKNTAVEEDEAKTVQFDGSNTQSIDTVSSKSRSVSRKSRAHSRTKSFVIDTGLSNEITSKIMNCLNHIDSWNDFNIFEFFDYSGHMAMPILGIRILKEYDLINKLNFDESKLINFFQCIQQIYNSEVPYHNEAHGGDVMTTCYQIVKSRKKSIFNSDKIQLQNYELFSLFVGAMVHDVGHNGFNNDFHIKTQSDLALLYNDVSVLENYHAATCWKLLGLKENDFFKGNTEMRNKIRKLSTDIILHTDMSRHNHLIASLNDINSKCNSVSNDDGAEPTSIEITDAERSVLLRTIVHTADISNPAKKLYVYIRFVVVCFVMQFTQICLAFWLTSLHLIL